MSLVKFWTMLETSIAAVSRVKEIVDGTVSEEQELNRGEVTAVVPLTWPAHGAIEYKNIAASYK